MASRLSACYKNIRWVPLTLFVCLFILLLRLGFWQLSRANEKESFLVTQQKQMLQKPVLLTDLLLSAEARRYRPVIFNGGYDIKHQLLVDNQVHGGKLGAFVLTPFILENNEGVVLVNRGWVAMDKSRQRLPELGFKMASSIIEVSGIVNEFPSVGLVLQGADEPSEGWPSMVQIINIEKLKPKLGYSVLPFQVQLHAEQANGYLRDWKINTRMPPEKHRAYAFQWFALATTLFFLTFWISCKTHKND